ncbi:CCA tRNA nucleotidyltransferase [Sphingomonas sp. ID0503]|uniref:CCA tRNA nucleotidyltransferase n=1 Tax=Sphingomonas sp. ID0503 TaxID=3399691 RepID=UPI003AFB7BE8
MDRIDPTGWQETAGLATLLDALGGDSGDTRFVGGFVRDTLLGVGSKDIDLAARFAPEETARRITAAGFKAVPTGMAHGTVTAVLPGGPVEVTTLRRDVSTDGRHAEVAFTDDWREDAARRDFTINALSAEPAGAVFDYFGGLDDLRAGLVRFIGDPLTRIAEDHLRIMRFFRFHARFGRGEPDAAAIAACTARAKDLMALSRERIADELLKLLALPDPVAAVRLMLRSGVLAAVIPEITAADGLAGLVGREGEIAPDPLRRLAALLPRDPEKAGAVAARLKLSNAARKRLTEAAAVRDEPARALAYRLGMDGAVDQLLLAGRDVSVLVGWERPRFDLSGGTLIGMGLTRGPGVAATLQAIERRWIAEDFPGEGRLAEITAEEVAQASRASI